MPQPVPPPIQAEDGLVVVRRGLPRGARVRSKAQFEQVFRSGRRSADPLLALHWPDDGNTPRLGLAVSRRVDGRAVGRNRIKRALRECFRHRRAQLRPGAYVVVARTPAAGAPGRALCEALQRRLRALGALPPPASLGTMPPAAAPATPSPDSRMSRP